MSSKLHLSFLEVHKYRDLVRRVVQVHVCGGFGAKGVITPGVEEESGSQ